MNAVEKKLLFIVNPRAGKTKSRAPLFDAVSIFSKAGYLVRVAETRRHGDATELAERFGASQISSTAKIVEVDTAAHTITAERDLERGTEVLRAKYPCLLTVEKANFRPRIPNLKRWKASRTADIAVYSAATIPGLVPAQIGVPGSPTKVPRTYPPEVGAKGSMIDEGSTEKNVDRLFERIADVL